MRDAEVHKKYIENEGNVMERTICFEAAGETYTFDGNTLRISLGNQPGETINGLTSSKHKSSLRSVALVLNNDCNLSCNYCYANHGRYDKPGINMSLETGTKTIDMLVQSLQHSHGKKITIGFFGGEPLLSFDLVQRLVEYCEDHISAQVRKRYLITTNGTLITSDMAKYFHEKGFHITLSIDGDERAHDSNRITKDGKGTYSTVFAAMKMLISANVETIARVTVSETNTDIFSAVQHLYEHGVNRITFANDHAMSRSAFGRFLGDLQKLIDWYFWRIKRGQVIDITNFSEPLCSIATKTKKVAHCKAGVTYVTVSADGKIYRCPRFVGNPVFQLEDHVPDGYQTIDVSLQRFRESLGENAGSRDGNCRQCVFVNLCGGVCYYHAHKASGQEFARADNDCSLRKLQYKKLLVGLCVLTTKERRNLFRGLITQWSQNGGL